MNVAEKPSKLLEGTTVRLDWPRGPESSPASCRPTRWTTWLAACANARFTAVGRGLNGVRAREPGPWLERSLRRHLEASRRELQRRLDRMEAATRGRIFPLPRVAAARL